ncbi:hypothetical protein ACE939_06440 [Aquimarina sp. W85]|uniref:hypothetical protein n=1 Tax=Aquimarina rhodophyticola TaxID=3342246 RepID=UPI00366D8CDF
MRNFLKITFFVLATATIVSCKKDPKSDSTELQEQMVDTLPVVEEPVVVEKPVVKKKKVVKKQKTKEEIQAESIKKLTIEMKSKGLPTFKESPAMIYIKRYEKYVADYKRAVEANDMDSFLKLSDASSALSREYRSLLNSLEGEDVEKMSKYMQAKSKQIDALSAKM